MASFKYFAVITLFPEVNEIHVVCFNDRLAEYLYRRHDADAPHTIDAKLEGVKVTLMLNECWEINDVKRDIVNYVRRYAENNGWTWLDDSVLVKGEID